MTYWKIEFNEGLTGTGWLSFDENMVENGLYDSEGNVVTVPVGYRPIDFNVTPEWVQYVA